MGSVISTRFSGPALLTNSTVTLVTVPTNVIYKDIEFHFTNTDTSAIGVDVYIVPNGGTAGDSTTFLKSTGANAFILGPGQTLPWSTEQVLIAGDTIQAKATTTGKIAYIISGREVTQG